MTQELFEEITNSRSSWAIWPDEEVESYREFFIENISRLNPNVIFLGLNRSGGKKNRSGNKRIADCSNFHKRGHRGDTFLKIEINRLEKLSGGFMTDIVSEIETFSSKVVSNQEEIDRFIDTLVKFNKEEITIICFGDKCYKFLNDRLIEGTKSKQENIGLLHHRTSYKNVNLNIYRVWHYSNWGKFEDKLVQLRKQLCEINNRLGYGSKPLSKYFIEERKNMATTEENYIEKINSISKLEWSPLLNLIPVIERTQNFGEVKGGDKLREGLFTMPYMSPSEIVSQFQTLSYELQIIINFDWGSWEDGRKMAYDENFNFDTIDIPTKCKLITAIVRNDRFCEGALVESFESGLILKLLKSIEKQLV